jgi:hypothetical protein
MKKISLYIVAIFSMIFLLTAFYAKADSPSTKANLPTASPSPYILPTLAGFGTSVPTVTSTLDYEKLGLPSPTITPTLDYPQLASHYLTPFPTSTAILPPWTPTSTPENLLLSTIARKLPANWKPTPPPLFDYTNSKNSIHLYIQAVTDLINFTNADQNLYLQYIKSWKPKERYSMGGAWILKNDFDNDGQSELLVSTPVYFQDTQMYCCGQFLLLFEKVEGVYHPTHYDWKYEHNDLTKVILVNDLNNDGYSEIVLRTVSCGTACGQLLTIATWDGTNWTNHYIQSVVTSLISFVDRDNDGKTEITLDYMTYYKLDSSYPARQATDTYGWKDGQLVIIEEYRQPTTNTYGILRDIYSAISFGKTQEALDLAQPVIDDLGSTCSAKETYIGIETMLAYAVKNDPKAMQATLSKIVEYCNQPRNGFTHAANVLWQAYQQVHDPVIACEAMKRFIVDEIRSSKKDGTGFEFFDVTVMLPGNYYNFCPFQQ